MSLCCSTYSRPDLFAESLAGLLRQQYTPLEIVVLVDGANPETCKLLASHREDTRLRWFSTPRPSGMIPAWNRVVRESKGKYFLYCADDDVLCDNAVEAQLDSLEANPSVGFCHADFHIVGDDGRRLGTWRSHEGVWVKKGLSEWPRYLLQPKACMQTCVVRREVWDLVGGWDEDAGYPGDNSLYLKLLRVCDVGHVARVACNYRWRTQNPDSYAKNANKVKEDVTLALKHLADIPAPLRDRKAALERAVLRYFARLAVVALGDDRGTPEEKAAFELWVRSKLLAPGSGTALYRWLLSFGCARSLRRWTWRVAPVRNAARETFRFVTLFRKRIVRLLRLN